jgi:hypothetical protein
MNKYKTKLIFRTILYNKRFQLTKNKELSVNGKMLAKFITKTKTFLKTKHHKTFDKIKNQKESFKKITYKNLKNRKKVIKKFKSILFYI